MDVETLAKEILEETHTMSLGTVDGNGPWVADVIFVTDDNMNLYWASSPETRHSKALDLDSRVAASIVADHTSSAEKALQIEGFARQFTGSPDGLAEKIEKKWGAPIPKDLDQRLTSGKVWYVLKPSKIEMLYTQHFKYERISVR